MKTSKIKRIITLVLAMACLVVFGVGALAYFTDTAHVTASFSTAGGIDIAVSDPSSPVPTDPTPDPGKALENIWKAKQEANIGDLKRPGDMADLSYRLTNLSDYAITVQETITLTVTDEAAAAMALSSTPEYQLFTAYKDNGNGGHTGTTVVATQTVSGNVITYTLQSFELAANASKQLDYALILNLLASNDFQNSVCAIDYDVVLTQQ